MIQLIKNLLAKWGCMHEWDKYEDVRIWDGGSRPIESRHTLICKKCGKIKRISL